MARSRFAINALGGFAVALICCELFLQGASFVGPFGSEPQVPARTESSEIRILALGESTTAASGLRAWPTQLEELLRAEFPERRIHVLNGAAVGTSSAFLLERAERWLPVYRPDFVISMMGYGDWGNVLQRQPEKTFQLMIPKLVKRVIRAKSRLRTSEIKSCGMMGPLSPPLPAERVRSLMGRIEQAPDRRPLVLLEEIPVPTGPDRAKLFFQAGTWFRRAARRGEGREDYPVIALEFFEEAYRIAPNCYETADSTSLQRMVLENTSACTRLLVDLHERGFELREQFLSRLSQCAGDSDPEATAILKEYGYQRSQTNDFGATREHYRRLAALVKDAGAQYIAMQYPTLSVGFLRFLFSRHPGANAQNFRNALLNFPRDLMPPVEKRYSEILFVENVKNFSEARRTHSYREIFIDRMGPEFGHATPLGNKIIAENVAKQISALIRAKTKTPGGQDSRVVQDRATGRPG